MKPRKILVATDFSPAAELAVRRAAALARQFKAELRVIHAMPPRRWLEGILGSRQRWADQVRSRASVALKAQAERAATGNGIEVSTGLMTARASVAIAAAAAQFDADLLVVGARGGGMKSNTRADLGQTAFKLMGTTEVPLLLVRRDDIDLPRRVLAALDLTPASRNVARWAGTIAGNDQLTVMHVFEAPFAYRLSSYGVSRKAIDVYASGQQAQCERALRAVLTEARVSGRVDRLVLRGDPVGSIATQLRKLRIDTLVIGKHTRRRRDAAAPYGSVCRYMANFAPVDVLVVV